MAKLISIAGMVVGAVGIFFGFYFLARAPALALSIVTGTTVGIAGVLAFIRHVVFHRSDAARLGWETDQPDWMFEVGFANLAFGAMGLLTAGINLGGRLHKPSCCSASQSTSFRRPCSMAIGISRLQSDHRPGSGAVWSPRALRGDDDVFCGSRPRRLEVQTLISYALQN